MWKVWFPSILCRGTTTPIHENVRKIIGQRTRREFSIGEKVRVILERADPLERKLQFSIVEPVKRPAKGKTKAAHKGKKPQS